MRYVIIGTSAAGLSAAETLRQWDRGGRITLISDEPHLPYSRPLLTYLLGQEIRPEQIFLKSAEYFDQWGFEALLGEPVAEVDPEAHAVHLADGRVRPFDRLLIASGAEPRLPGIPGQDLEGVFTLRHLADVQRLEAGLPPDGTVAVIGAGAVGLKAAEALTHRGHRVILVEAEPHALPRLLDKTGADFLHRALTDLGVELRFGTQPVGILGEKGRVQGLALTTGEAIAADAVLCAIGVRPRTGFLAGAGLDRPEGIAVNPYMQTGHSNIYAAGDCTCPPHLLTGEPAAYQIWPAAVAQGEIAGANMAGARRRYDGILPRNSISLTNLKVITGGHLYPDREEGEVVIELDQKRTRYRRLVFQNGRLVGVTLVGPIADAGIYFQIMAQKLPVKQLPADIRSPDFHPGKLWG
jgi:NADPH-dependent 2,4-dienoyl-CoA reductase/sulfur reductase-like enzyme